MVCCPRKGKAAETEESVVAQDGSCEESVTAKGQLEGKLGGWLWWLQDSMYLPKLRRTIYPKFSVTLYKLEIL